MTKKECSPGKKWDNLVSDCIKIPPAKNTPEPKPPTEPTPIAVQHTHTRPTISAVQANPVMMLSPALWIFVGLATMGSIVALALWFVIYRRQTRINSTSEEPGHEPLQKTEPLAKFYPLPSEINGQAETLQRAMGIPSPCPHLHFGGQTSSKWEEGFTACRGPAKHAGTEGGEGLPTCSSMREHRIPLPATELGGTALVTTKTV